jgi:hypothetical protein
MLPHLGERDEGKPGAACFPQQNAGFNGNDRESCWDFLGIHADFMRNIIYIYINGDIPSGIPLVIWCIDENNCKFIDN